MTIDNHILTTLEAEAQSTPRLRANRLLHASPNDKVQKMVDVLLPGTEMPIHRHLNTAETLIILKGEIDIVYYDDKGNETDSVKLSSQCGNYVIDIPIGQWHTVQVTMAVALMEIKEGPYRPLQENEILK